MLCRRSLIAAFLLVACAGNMLSIRPMFGQEQPASSEDTAATAEERSPAAASEVADATVAEPSVPADAAPLRIQLIKVRSDWSQGKDPEGTKKALESLLENETLRDEIRENLLGSGSQILFPEGYLAVYKPQELAASLAWMEERDLMQWVAESEPIANHERPDWARHYTSGCSTRVFATEDMIPMTTQGSDDVPPFTKRTYGVEWIFLSWKVFEKDLTSTKEIAFRLAQAQQRLDRLLGESGKVVSLDYYGGGGCDGTCPPDQVAVLHGFFNSPAIRQYTREKGWEPLLVIVPAGQKQIEVKTSKLTRLVSLQRIGKGNVLPPRTAPAEEEKEPTPEEPRIKIFHLVHARADQMVAILRQLFPEITMSGDERTNSLVAQGEERRLEVAEAVIQRLDETPSQKQEPALDEASRRRILETASTDFASAEAQIQSIVKDLAGEPDKKTSEQLRARLAGLVADAFDLRQKLQRVEVGLLREKIKIVETRLAQRDTLRKEIIDRRVEELLGDEAAPSGAQEAGEPSRVQPAVDGMVRFQFDQKPWKDVLQWFAEARGYRLRIMDPIPEDETFTCHSPEPVTLDQAFDILRAALSDLGYRFYEVGSFSGGKKSLSLQATEAEALRKKVAELQSQVARWQEALADETTPRSDEEVATLQNRLESAQAEVALYSKGFVDRTNRYRQLLSSAERQAAAARQKWEELKKLQASGDATEAEVAAAQQAFERADKSYQFQKTQVDQLRKAAAAVGLSVPEAQGAEGSTTPPQEAPAKPPLPPIAPAAAPANPRPTLPLRSPEEFQRLASEARQSIERLEIRVGTKDDYEGLQNDLRSARERLTLIQAEFATQVQALESEVRKAELEYSVAESKWRTVDEAVQRVPDSYSKNDVNKYRATSEVAKARLEQVKALLELYRKAGETADLKAAGTANASPDAPPRAAVTAPLAGVETTAFRTPDQFQKTLHEARRQTAYIQKTVDELPARREELGKRYESELANAKQDLATARQCQELVEAEYAAQIQLFKTALEAAESKLKAAAETLALMESRFKSGQTHRTEVTKAQLEYDQAKALCDQAKILLDLYTKVEPSVNKKPDEPKPAPEQDPTPGDAAKPD